MPPTRRNRRARTGDLSALQSLVDSLIKENRALKRQLDKLASAAGSDLRPIASLVRKLERTLANGRPSTGSRRAATARPTTTRRPRRPASPETLEKRRQALARAREVRAAKLRGETATTTQ